ncbi:MAG TPA: GspE/PulE family protein [Candidatus Saccharimonadales bacterium]
MQDLKTALVKENYISDADSKRAEAVASTVGGYIDFLVGEGLLTKTLLGQALAEMNNVPFADLSQRSVTKDTLGKVPAALAREYRLVFIKEAGDTVTVATDTVSRIQPSMLAELFPNKKIQLCYTLPEYITDALSSYETPLATRFSQIIAEGKHVAPEIIDEIIKDAIAFRVSDIHFEPQANKIIMRFRVDGQLRLAGELPTNLYENILNHVKVESGMRIDEHLAPQDGAMQKIINDSVVDLRVSLIPTVQGEKIALRVLASYVQNYTFADIGLSETHNQSLLRHAAKPFGMILAVGPTGSGKTTTLYALVKMLNQPNVNITSIEDPVEYKIMGVNQIQVREAAKVTFARGLRSIVRQDPNIILVGEVRDGETAEIAVNAALTGHLLLSTMHANNAAAAIPRLMDMGIEPFLLASTLEVIIAQRLVRKICPNCRTSISVGEALKPLGKVGTLVSRHFSPEDSVFMGKGCNVCNNTGYSGRTALFEFVEITPDIKELILSRPSISEIEKAAYKQGNLPMFMDGMQKVKSGYTTISEVLRVVELPGGSNAH